MQAFAQQGAAPERRWVKYSLSAKIEKVRKEARQISSVLFIATSFYYSHLVIPDKF